MGWELQIAGVGWGKTAEVKRGGRECSGMQRGAEAPNRGAEMVEGANGRSKNVKIALVG